MGDGESASWFSSEGGVSVLALAPDRSSDRQPGHAFEFAPLVVRPSCLTRNSGHSKVARKRNQFSEFLNRIQVYKLYSWYTVWDKRHYVSRYGKKRLEWNGEFAWTITAIISVCSNGDGNHEGAVGKQNIEQHTIRPTGMIVSAVGNSNKKDTMLGNVEPVQMRGW